MVVVVGVGIAAYAMSNKGDEETPGNQQVAQNVETGAPNENGTGGDEIAEAPPRSVEQGNSRKPAGWVQWRGPNRDGISTETGLLESWPVEGPSLAWRVSGLGSGMSSVVISGEYLCTLGDKGGCKIHCRKLSDGSEVWSTQIGGYDPNCTPTVDPEAGLVFGMTKQGELGCVDAKTGDLVWKKHLQRDFGGTMMSDWGYSESPLVDGDRLICTPGARDAVIVALDKKTGEAIWKANQPANVGRNGKDGAGYSSIVISQGGGVKQYVQLTGRGLISVAAADGRTLWTYNRVANGVANVPTPIVKGDYVFCSTGYGTGAGLLKLTKNGNGVNAEEVYFLGGDTLQNHHGGMILVGDHLYMGHGHNNGFPVCVEFSTGRIVWGGKLRGAGSGSAAVACADGHLYFRYEDATMALIEATPERYNLKGKFKIAAHNDKSWSHPVIYEGRLYLRDQDELLCYEIRR
jgi:outer membrane protein assembly factor BamB